MVLAPGFGRGASTGGHPGSRAARAGDRLARRHAVCGRAGRGPGGAVTRVPALVFGGVTAAGYGEYGAYGV